MIKDILFAVLVLGLMGALFGLLLAIASKVFAVKTDKRLPLVEEALPGANCGGCGYTGCTAYANAIVSGSAKTNLCPVGGQKTAEEVAVIMGTEAEKPERLRAVVLCSGSGSMATTKYDYIGAGDCVTVSKLGGGIMDCPYGCVGLGTCVSVCKFGALKLKDNLAYVDYMKCVGCGMCAAACPKGLIKLIPYDSRQWVACSNKDKGADTRKVCDAGCIGCGICAKNCPENAVILSENLARIDYEKCTGCGICAEKCPRKIILSKKTAVKSKI